MGEKFDPNDPILRNEINGFSTENPISSERAQEIPLPSRLLHPFKHRRVVNAIGRASFAENLRVVGWGRTGTGQPEYNSRKELVSWASAHERTTALWDTVERFDEAANQHDVDDNR